MIFKLAALPSKHISGSFIYSFLKQFQSLTAISTSPKYLLKERIRENGERKKKF